MGLPLVICTWDKSEMRWMAGHTAGHRRIDPDTGAKKKTTGDIGVNKEHIELTYHECPLPNWGWCVNLAGESEVWLTQLISAADLTSMVQHRHRRRITSMLYQIELLKKTRVRSGCSMILLHQAIPFPVLSLAGPKHHFVLVCAIR